MKSIRIEDFLELLDYRPKHVGKELCDPVRFVEFRTRNCHSPSLEFGTKPDAKKGGQYLYFEVIDFRNYDMSKGEIITEDRRHGVINAHLNESNMKQIASDINMALKKVYSKDGPAW